MRFQSESLWASIHRVAEDSGRKWVAVPYVAGGAAKRFRLEKGDVLVVRFDDATIRSGGTDPKEILKYLRKGVSVHSREDLHAKVYVSARRAVVGSANLSSTSELRLVEAGVVSTEAGIIRKAKAFVLEQCGQEISQEWAKSKAGLFVPRKVFGVGKKPEDRGPKMWVVSLTLGIPFTAAAESASKRAIHAVERKIKDESRFAADDFRFTPDLSVAEGDWIIQCVTQGRKKWFEAPVRVRHIERFPDRGHPMHMVGYEERKHLRVRTPRALIAKMRGKGLQLRIPKSYYQIRSPALRDALFREWPGVER